MTKSTEGIHPRGGLAGCMAATIRTGLDLVSTSLKPGEIGILNLNPRVFV